MKRLKLTKIIASLLIGVSVFAFNPIKASAYTGQVWVEDGTKIQADSSQWVKDNTGWRCGSDEQPYVSAWICTNGSWYYVGKNGYMLTDVFVNGYYVNKNGQWIIGAKSNGVGGVIYPNATTTNSTTTNTNTSTYSNNNNIVKSFSNKPILKKQNFDGTNGFKEVEDNQYVYYENGVMLNHCWREFDDGIRYFDDNGYMISDYNLPSNNYLNQDVKLGTNGTLDIPKITKFQKLSNDEIRKYARNSIATYLEQDYRYANCSLDYIKDTADIFGIKVTTEYKDIYTNKELDGTVAYVVAKWSGGAYISNLSSIAIGYYKYTSRISF